MYFNQKSKKIILLGHGTHLAQVKEVLTPAHVHIIKEVSSLNELILFLKRRKRKLSVICCLLSEQEYQIFFDVMMYCYHHDIPFLHPAFALTDCEFPPPITPRIRTFGFPGSGNMLLQDFIYTHLPPAQKSNIEMIYAWIGSHYLNFFHHVLENILGSKFKFHFTEESSVTYCAAENYRGIFRIAQDSEAQSSFLLQGFPCPSFTWDAVLSDHGFVDKMTIDFYKTKKFNQLLIIRHPVDVIFSNLKKLNCANSENKYQVITLITKYYRNFMNVALKNKDNIYTIKYEDILFNTIPTLLKLGKACLLKVSDESIEKWKNEKLYTILPHALSDHYQGGGIGKWKDNFDSHCFKIFEEFNILSLVEELGYPKIKLPQPTEQATPSKGSPTELAIIKNKLDFYYHPFWHINSSNNTLITPGDQKIYYRFHHFKGVTENEFKNNSLPLQLVIDSFYINKKSMIIKYWEKISQKFAIFKQNATAPI